MPAKGPQAWAAAPAVSFNFPSCILWRIFETGSSGTLYGVKRTLRERNILFVLPSLLRFFKTAKEGNHVCELLVRESFNGQHLADPFRQVLFEFVIAFTLHFL